MVQDTTNKAKWNKLGKYSKHDKWLTAFICNQLLQIIKMEDKDNDNSKDLQSNYYVQVLFNNHHNNCMICTLLLPPSYRQGHQDAKTLNCLPDVKNSKW